LCIVVYRFTWCHSELPFPRFPILLDEKQPRRYPEGHNS